MPASSRCCVCSCCWRSRWRKCCCGACASDGHDRRAEMTTPRLPPSGKAVATASAKTTSKRSRKTRKMGRRRRPPLPRRSRAAEPLRRALSGHLGGPRATSPQCRCERPSLVPRGSRRRGRRRWRVSPPFGRGSGRGRLAPRRSVPPPGLPVATRLPPPSRREPYGARSSGRLPSPRAGPRSWPHAAGRVERPFSRPRPKAEPPTSCRPSARSGPGRPERSAPPSAPRRGTLRPGESCAGHRRRSWRPRRPAPL